MGKAPSDGIPQVIAIVPVSREGRVSLKKDVRNYLGAGQGALYLDSRKEILLTARQSPTGKPAQVLGNRLRLPGEVVAKLTLGRGSLLAMIQRAGAVALKKMEVAEREGDVAQVADFETAHKVTRVAEANPMPGKLLPRLSAQDAHLALKHDVREFLRGRRTLAAWKARKLLGMAEPSDEALTEALIRERLEKQKQDGSWDGRVIITAKKLRELADLGMTKGDDEVQRAVDWLMARPQSAYNPGMFFAADGLVEEQACIIEARKGGRGGRFRELKTSEKKRVMAGDDLIRAPCGPRIMWPNALVLEALLHLGYEAHDRVQTALRTMTTHEWCECGYQHGSSGWRSIEPLTMDAIEKMETDCVGQFKYGGISSIADLEKMDLTKKVGVKMFRVSHRSERGVDIFPLGVPVHIQGCEFITTRAMSRVGNEKMRRFAEAHLWRFASQQHAPNGEFAVERYGSGFGQAGMLQVFASYDHPASKVVIMRSLPWIADAQNEDGSWGEEPRKDASTLAILNALVSLGDQTPSGLVP